MNGLKIAFLHPDLGIGGAERLIVDAAVGLQQKGHDVTVFTSHHGVKAFDETKDGTLKVITHGDFLPRTVFNRFYIFFAIIRAMYLAFVVALKYPGFDVIVCDQNAAYIPILRLLSKSKVVFYCHHPDYVQTPHNSLLKILYRLPFDLFEEYCVSMADSILVNSYYTQSVYKRSFRVISYFSSVLPSVLYPCVDYSTIRQLADKGRIPTELKGCRYFVSVNRYEHKKEVEKAILGFSHLRNKYGEDALQKQKLRLVIVGGYDPRLSENVDYFRELNELAMKEGVADYVLFIRNCSQEEKAAIIKNSIALIYTPKNEHFGIVPLEGMALGRPVIADNSGGPKESIVPGLNGFLCDHWEDYGIAMGELVEKKELGDKLGAAGSKRVEELFSFATFSDQFDREVRNVHKKSHPQLLALVLLFFIPIYAVINLFSSVCCDNQHRKSTYSFLTNFSTSIAFFSLFSISSTAFAFRTGSASIALSVSSFSFSSSVKIASSFFFSSG